MLIASTAEILCRSSRQLLPTPLGIGVDFPTVTTEQPAPDSTEADKPATGQTAPCQPGTGQDGWPARLATYGTLRIGHVGHDVVAPVGGHWSEGFVRGWYSPDGFGRTLGFPGVILDPDGELIAVSVLHAAALDQWWPVVDDYEGPCYERVVTDVVDEQGTVIVAAQIYVVV